MLCAAPNVTYVNEPFSPAVTLPIATQRFKTWFQCVTEENEQEFMQVSQDFMAFKYPLFKNVLEIRKPQHVMRLMRYQKAHWLAALNNDVPLVKDPIAIFSAEWLAKTFDMEVVVMIRHPAAFVSSLIFAGWGFPWDHLLKQPILMKTYLSKYEEDMHKMVSGGHEKIDEGILLWKIFYDTVLTYKKAHPDWYYPTHESLSAEPVKEYEKLYGKLGLQFTEAAKNTIEAKSGAHNPVEQSKSTGHEFVRNAKENIKNWKNRLNAEQIDYIRERTEPLSSHFYTDSDW